MRFLWNHKILKDARPQGIAYCLARPDWRLSSVNPLALFQCKPWLVLIQCQPEVQPHLLASAHVSAANTLMLLIKMPALVTVYRGHCRTLYFLPGIISLIIMCIEIITATL